MSSFYSPSFPSTILFIHHCFHPSFFISIFIIVSIHHHSYSPSFQSIIIFIHPLSLLSIVVCVHHPLHSPLFPSIIISIVPIHHYFYSPLFLSIVSIHHPFHPPLFPSIIVSIHHYFYLPSFFPSTTIFIFLIHHHFHHLTPDRTKSNLHPATILKVRSSPYIIIVCHLSSLSSPSIRHCPPCTVFENVSREGKNSTLSRRNE